MDPREEAVRARLADSDAGVRAEALFDAADQGLAGLLPVVGALREDRAPFLFGSDRDPLVGEVRFAAWDTWLRLGGVAEGEAEVRIAMPAQEALSRAAASLGPDAPKGPLAAYRALQAQGLVPYRRESVDPDTRLLPVQAEVARRQLPDSGPGPRLTLARAGVPLVVARCDARGVLLQTSEAPGADEALRFVESVRSITPGCVPKVSFGPDGAPSRDADGALVLEGVLPETDGPALVLRSLWAFCRGRYEAALTD